MRTAPDAFDAPAHADVGAAVHLSHDSLQHAGQVGVRGPGDVQILGSIGLGEQGLERLSHQGDDPGRGGIQRPHTWARSSSMDLAPTSPSSECQGVAAIAIMTIMANLRSVLVDTVRRRHLDLPD